MPFFWKNNFDKYVKKLLVFFFFLGIFFEIFVFKYFSDFFLLLLIFNWMFLIWKLKLEFKFNFLIGSILLITQIFVYSFSNNFFLRNKLINLAYIFLLFGSLQGIFDFVFNKERKVRIERFYFFLNKTKKKINDQTYEIKQIGFMNFISKKRILSDTKLKCYEKCLSLKLKENSNKKSIQFFLFFIKLVRNIVASWPLVFSLIILFLIFGKYFSELHFYKFFYQETFFKKFLNNFKFSLVFWFIFILSSISYCFRKKFKNIKYKRETVLFFIIIFGLLNSFYIKKIRASFEYSPYISKIIPDIASIWMEVEIHGRNFSDLPFSGKVLIDGKEQKIKRWEDNLVVIEIDPMLSESNYLKIISIKFSEKGIKESNKVWFTLYNSLKATPEEETRFWELLEKEAINE